MRICATKGGAPAWEPLSCPHLIPGSSPRTCAAIHETSRSSNGLLDRVKPGHDPMTAQKRGPNGKRIVDAGKLDHNVNETGLTGARPHLFPPVSCLISS